MKRSAIFLLIGMAFLAAQNAKSGSAVAWDRRGHLVSLHGFSVDEAKRRALEIARSRYGPDVRILAATDAVGYGAIAVARKGTGSVIGVALGRSSATDAERLAIQQWLMSGGADPKVRWRFRG